MKKILLISDTHGYIDDVILKYAKKADLVIHAGDIGDINVIDSLSKVSNLRAVYGNIDSAEIRSITNENELLNIEGFKILTTHIAGKQPNYNSRLKKISTTEKSKLETFINDGGLLLIDCKLNSYNIIFNG